MLIGSSEERLRLLQQSKEELRQSEETDRRREQQRIETENQQKLTDEYLEDLRRRRESRVSSEPDIVEDHVVVCVRHVDLGVITRAFRPQEKMNAVHDWIGSLQKRPEHFRFHLPRGRVLTSEQSVSLAARNTLTMEVCEAEGSSTPSSPEAQSTDVQHNQDHLLQQPESPDSRTEPPRILLEDDEAVSEEDTLACQLVQSLEQRRQEALQTFLEEKHVIVSKSNLVQQVLDLYADYGVSGYKMRVTIDEYDATGDGVLREFFAMFWEEFLSNNSEGAEHYTLALQPSYSDSVYEALGRLIEHQFLMCGTLPLQLVEALLHQLVSGRVDPKCLERSLLSTMTSTERQVVNDAIYGRSFDTSRLLGILADYGVQTFPRPDNIKEIVLEVARAELVRKPFYALTKMKEGMSANFRRLITTKDIAAMYHVCVPTPKNLLATFYSEPPRDPEEEKTFRWLMRYVGELSKESASKLLRFVTACETVIPDKRIKVEYDTMSEAALRPRARTCFRILVLPKNYRTYVQMKRNIDCHVMKIDHWDLED